MGNFDFKILKEALTHNSIKRKFEFELIEIIDLKDGSYNIKGIATQRYSDVDLQSYIDEYKLSKNNSIKTLKTKANEKL